MATLATTHVIGIVRRPIGLRNRRRFGLHRCVCLATVDSRRTAEQNENMKSGSTSLDVAAEHAIRQCGGDPVATVKALLVTLDLYEKEVEELRRDVDRLVSSVSAGYVRKRSTGWLP